MIDAVITWVNGSDPLHAKKRAKAMVELGQNETVLDNGTYDTRFADCGEIYWCIASILKYAPFVRRIFLVTDAQEPRFLSDFVAENLVAPGRIRVVDHREIFRNHCEHLPTFSSLSIEAMIHRINGLADTFIYLNDDFFLTKPAVPNDFIDTNGQVILHGQLRNLNWPLSKLYLRRMKRRIFADGHVSAHYKSANAQSAKLAKLNQYLQIEHVPHILRRATLAEAYASLPGLLTKQISHKFRHIDQILPVGLANHTEIFGGNARVEPMEKVAYMKPGIKGDIITNLRRISKEETRFGCIQSFDEIAEREPDHAANIVTVMDEVFGSHMPSPARLELKDRYIATGDQV